MNPRLNRIAQRICAIFAREVHDIRLSAPTAEGTTPFRSIKGMPLNGGLTVRYALDSAKENVLLKNPPDDIAGQIVRSAVQSVICTMFTRYTLREIFSSKRVEIQQLLEAELQARLAADGILLRSVQIGQLDRPADERQEMDKLLAEELATAKMRYTLALKEKRVKETELNAQTEKVHRESNAQAAASEHMIAVRTQEEATRGVLPFEQKQIEQRQVEADQELRIRTAESNAPDTCIETSCEARSRQKPANAEVYRSDRVGKFNSEQIARDGVLITRHPLLVQKITVRYALDPAKIKALPTDLPDDIACQIVEAAVQYVVYKVFTRYTVREIFLSKRAEIQQIIEAELRPKLAADGIALRTVQMGKLDRNADC